MLETKMGKDICPLCGITLDMATSVEGEHIPNPGDYSICIGCVGWLKYGSDMELQPVSKLDIQSMDKDLLLDLERHSKTLRDIKSGKIK